MASTRPFCMAMILCAASQEGNGEDIPSEATDFTTVLLSSFSLMKRMASMV